MTLTEYLNQSGWIPLGSVIIERSEIHKSWEVEGGHNVALKLMIEGEGEHFTYFVLKNDTLLWTIDDKGRMNVQSVFKLKEPL